MQIIDDKAEVMGIQSTDPGFLNVTAKDYTIEFPALFTSGEAPDTALPPGTAITATVKAENTVGASVRESNTFIPQLIAPEGSAGPITGSTASNVNGSWTGVTEPTGGWQDVAFGDGQIFVAVGNSGTYAIMTSSDGITWAKLTANNINKSFNGIASQTGSGYVAVGNNGVCMRSAAGTTWTDCSMPNSNSYYAVTSGGAYWVAVGANSSIIYSNNNAASFSFQQAPEDQNWSGIAYGNSTFVAVGDASYNKIMWASSNDINTWTMVTSPATDSLWKDVAFGNGKFVAVAKQGTTENFIYSSDGKNWTAVDALESLSDWSSITYGDGKFVVVSESSNYTALSEDGINWTAVSDVSGTWKGVAYGDDKFAAVASGGTNSVMWSLTGGVDINLNTLTVGSSANLDGFVANDSLVMVDDTGAVASYTPTTTAITGVVDEGGWETEDIPAQNDWRPMASGNGIISIVANSENTDQIATSTDNGLTWGVNNQGSGFNKNFQKMLFVNNRFLLFAYTSLAYQSTDGENFTTTGMSGPDPSGSWGGAASNGNTVVVVNGAASSIGVQRSTDGGTNWEPAFQPVPDQIPWGPVTYGNGVWVAGNIGNKTDLMYSTDNAVSWTQFNGPTQNWWYGADYGNGKFMLVGGSGKLLTSSTGLPGSFEAKNVPQTTRLSDVAYGNGTWVTIGQDYIYSSTNDGETWNVFNYPGTTFHRVIWTGTQFVVSAQGLTVYLSPTGLASSTSLTFTDNQDLAFLKSGDLLTSNAVTALTPAFSTTLYTGNTPSTQSITSGIDNTSKALVWIKSRTRTQKHILSDTLSTASEYLSSNLTAGLTDNSSMIESFTSNGFAVGIDAAVNSEDLVAWNFRGAPGFMDIVEYEGNNISGTEIPHNLGVKPGFFILKSVNSDDRWVVYHSALGATTSMALNLTDAANPNYDTFGNTEPTDKVFTVGSKSWANGSGTSFIAYLFADTPGTIKCGSYPGTGGPQTIDCGFKPAFVMTKSSDNPSDWFLMDDERPGKALYANGTTVEQNVPIGYVSNGFTVDGSTTALNASGYNYIYVAIAENATGTGFPNTGTLTADADTVNNTVNLSNTSGTWAATQTATGPAKSGVGNFVSTNGSTELTVDNSNNQWISNNNALSKDFFAKKAFTALNANDPAHVALQQAIVTAFANVKTNASPALTGDLYRLLAGETLTATEIATLTDRLTAATHGDRPFHLDGYYPLYYTAVGANAASPSNSSHTHVLGGNTYYMPDGVTIYHGTYVPTPTKAYAVSPHVSAKQTATSTTTTTTNTSSGSGGSGGGGGGGGGGY